MDIQMLDVYVQRIETNLDSVNIEVKGLREKIGKEYVQRIETNLEIVNLDVERLREKIDKKLQKEKEEKESKLTYRDVWEDGRYQRVGCVDWDAYFEN